MWYHSARSVRMRLKYFMLKNHVCCRRAIIAYLILLTVIILLPWRHSCSLTDYVPVDAIPDHVLTTPLKTNHSIPCPVFPQQRFRSPFAIYDPRVDEKDLESLASRLGIRRGGSYSPSECTPQIRVAVVVPYRDRPDQLAIFVTYMHHFLTYQRINYTIIVVEQTFSKDFNRGKLFNVGFNEAVKRGHSDCFVFHDVDLLPEDGLNVYACTHQPRHLITALNTFRYNLPYCDIFGGAVAFTREQFTKINGFDNNFYGWGGEDDNLSERVQDAGYEIMRWDPKVARYTMLYHPKEAPNENRFKLMEQARLNKHADGLDNLKYTLRHYEQRPLYTLLIVDL